MITGCVHGLPKLSVEVRPSKRQHATFFVGQCEASETRLCFRVSLFNRRSRLDSSDPDFRWKKTTLSSISWFLIFFTYQASRSVRCACQRWCSESFNSCSDIWKGIFSAFWRNFKGSKILLLTAFVGIADLGVSEMRGYCWHFEMTKRQCFGH